ncbi:hypothetical protein PHYSODRAFT_490928, partial [Phytophthora sojae]
DYQDAALLNILWYLLGLSSDTMCLVKNQVAVYPGGCLFITFKRMKSASNEGASIFHDPNDFSSCPIHALALATIMQSTPSEFLMDQLPRDTQEVLPTEIGETPLRELLDARTRSPATSNSDNAKKATVPGIHAYVNRVLQKWSGVWQTEGTNLTPGLSSHSFRRGAAQNANSDSKISTPWILDRGGWSMSAVSKAFNYIVGTTQGDQTVGKSLAGWDLKANDELLRRQTLLLEQQTQILGGLAAEVKALNQRVQRLEHPSDVTTALSPTAAGSLSSSSSALSDTASGAATRAHSRAKPLATVVSAPVASARPNRRRYHECKVAVAFMRVFLPAGYNVTGDEVTAKGRILSSGREAEANVFAFLEAKNVKAKSHGTIVKVLKRMYAQGKLDDRIRNYQRLKQEGKALKDALVYVLEPYNSHSTT